MKYITILNHARHNRKNPTESESKFWNQVRGKKLLGLKFNRQFVISYHLHTFYIRYFIADFYCHSMSLVIELDGRVHEYQKEYDQYRDEILNNLGLTVVRFNNHTVLNDWNHIEKAIETFLINTNPHEK